MDSVPSGTPTNCWPSYFHPGATRPDGVFVALRSWFCDGKNEWDVWWFSKELLNSSWINARRIAKKYSRCHVLSTEARSTGSSSKDSGGISSTHRIAPPTCATSTISSALATWSSSQLCIWEYTLDLRMFKTQVLGARGAIKILAKSFKLAIHTFCSRLLYRSPSSKIDLGSMLNASDVCVRLM